MRALPAALTGLVCMALLAPAASAQDHAHAAGAGFVIVHDVAPDGHTELGALNHFGVLAVGDDLVPDFHQDVPVRVLLNGTVVFETTADSGHDYDGVQTFAIPFWGLGPYEVQALDEEGQVAASFGGVVALPDMAFALGGGSWSAPLLAGEAEKVIEFDDDGSAAPSDTLMEVLQGDTVVAAVHLHGQDQTLRYALPGHLLRPWAEFYTAQPDLAVEDPFPALEWTFALPPPLGMSVVQAGPTGPGVGNLPTEVAQPPTEANAVIDGDARDGVRLVGTYDPWTSVGPDTLQNLAVLVLDEASGTTLRDVDFTMRLVDAVGRTYLASDDLHEGDGVLELAVRLQLPGVYTWEVTATKDDWSGSIAMPYTVTPPVDATAGSAGAVDVTLDDARPQAGVPADMVLRATAADQPFAHTDLLVEVLGGPRFIGFGGPPLVLRTKLHTHGDGAYPFTFTFPAPGTYDLRITPSPLEARPVVLDDSYLLQVTVGGDVAPSEGTDPRDTPGPSLVVLAAALVAAAFALRRRS